MQDEFTQITKTLKFDTCEVRLTTRLQPHDNYFPDMTNEFDSGMKIVADPGGQVVLRRRSAAARLQGLRVRIPLAHGYLCLVFVSCR